MVRPVLGHKPLSDGTVVRVRNWMPPGHVRAPAYLRGKSGVIERAIAPFKNPEQLAYGLPASTNMLYRVQFRATDVWGEAAEKPGDVIEAEIYAHWIEELEPAHAT
mgnify:CR=1 FL=1